MSKSLLTPAERKAPAVQSRPIHTIADEIRKVWRRKDGSSAVYFGAEPYLKAMAHLTLITDNFFEDDAQDVVIYFLSNASTWRGEDARRIKRELSMLLPPRYR